MFEVKLLVLLTISFPFIASIQIPVPHKHFMCYVEEKAERHSQGLLQSATTSCAEGDKDCIKYTISPKSQGIPTQSDFRNKVNWANPQQQTESFIECDECFRISKSIVSFCRKTEQNPKNHSLEFVQHCLTENNQTVSGEKCLKVYDGVRNLFCPSNPCVNLRQSLQSSKNAVCSSTAINCYKASNNTISSSSSNGNSDNNNNNNNNIVSPQTPPAPVEALLYHKPEFSPPHQIPPLSCIEYTNFIQTKCINDFYNQFSYCNNFDGLKNSGCSKFVTLLFSLNPIQNGDLCYSLFNIIPNDQQPTTFQISTNFNSYILSEQTKKDAKSVCDSMNFPYNSPLPIIEWLEANKPKPEIIVKPVEIVETPVNVTIEQPIVPVVQQPEKIQSLCIEAPTPTPIPRGVIRVFPKPPGYKTSIVDPNKSKRILFQCDATNSWTTITPKTGCFFSSFNHKVAGFADPFNTYPCYCECSGQKSSCPAGSQIFWSSIKSGEDCSQMICNSEFRFSKCIWDDSKHVKVVVSEDGSWNGDTVSFTSSVLQDTCKGPTATPQDFCGTIVRGNIKNGNNTENDFSNNFLQWKIRSADGTIIAASKKFLYDQPQTATSQGDEFWLACGNYSVELTDSSFDGGFWKSYSLKLVDRNRFTVKSFGNVDAVRSHQEAFEISAEGLSKITDGLCKRCYAEPYPCMVISTYTEHQVCEPFVKGTQECPVGTMRCE